MVSRQLWWLECSNLMLCTPRLSLSILGTHHYCLYRVLFCKYHTTTWLRNAAGVCQANSCHDGLLCFKGNDRAKLSSSSMIMVSRVPRIHVWWICWWWGEGGWDMTKNEWHSLRNEKGICEKFLHKGSNITMIVNTRTLDIGVILCQRWRYP